VGARGLLIAEQLQTAINSRILVEQAKGVAWQAPASTWTKPSG
jgi:hypothetical protein